MNKKGYRYEKTRCATDAARRAGRHAIAGRSASAQAMLQFVSQVSTSKFNASFLNT
jgi:hypothetical protein